MYSIDNFIGVFPNALSDEICDNTIKLYNDLNHLRLNRQQFVGVPKTKMDNDLVFPGHESEDSAFFHPSWICINDFTQAFWNCYELYRNEYDVLDGMAQHSFYNDIKIQHNKPGQGYHVWHCEVQRRQNGSRLLLALAYLNDVEEGGETEFLYQKRRIKPEKGTLIICPSGFTHTHRGNPPLSGDKYVINGWVEFTQ